MEQFQSRYSIFNRKLDTIITSLPEVYTKEAPTELEHATLIPKFLPVDDPDFAAANMQNLALKFTVVSYATKMFIHKVELYIKDKSQSSRAKREKRFKKLLWHLGSLTMQISGLIILPDEQVIDMNSGISGINSGVDQSNLDVNAFLKLDAMCKKLKTDG